MYPPVIHFPTGKHIMTVFVSFHVFRGGSGWIVKKLMLFIALGFSDQQRCGEMMRESGSGAGQS